MTIREKIIEGLLIVGQERLEKLEAMSAPVIIIEGQKKYVENLKSGKSKIKIGGDVEVLEEEFSTVEVKKGRGGKAYYTFNNSINFFPQARYGMYVAKVEK